MRRLVVVLCATALGGAGCGGPGRPTGAAGVRAATSPASSAGATASSGATTSIAAPDVASRPGGTSGSPSIVTTTSAATTGDPWGPAAQPASPGTYLYTQSGSSTVSGSTRPVPSQGKTVVDAPVPSGSGSSEKWHTYVDPSEAPDDLSLLFTTGGVSVQTEVIRYTSQGQTVTFSCTFSPPMTVLPWPPRTGYSFSGSADCGSFTLHAAGSVDGQRQVVVGPAPVTAFVIDWSATTKGQLDSTEHETQWFAPRPGIDVHEVSDESGNYGPFAFQATVTRDVSSTSPQ